MGGCSLFEGSPSSPDSKALIHPLPLLQLFLTEREVLGVKSVSADDAEVRAVVSGASP